MEGKDNIKELFSQKLGSYQAKVSPELWAKISTQVAASASTTVTTGISLFTKVAIGLGVSVAAITTVVILSISSNEVVSEKPLKEVQKHTPKSTILEVEKAVKVQDKETVETSRSPMNPLSSTTTTAIELPRTSNTGIQKAPESPIRTLTTREVLAVSAGTSEPQIVEGVSYQGMTNYGSTPVNEPDTSPEQVTTKTEAVKRYVNVFTPNGDGRNDYFFLESEGLTDFSVVVFNPTGEIVFQSNDPNFKWDGRDIRSGEIVVSGTYMYMVSAYDSEGNPYPIYEQITINH